MALCSPTVAGVIAENNVNNVSGLQVKDSFVNYSHNVYAPIPPRPDDIPLPCVIISTIRDQMGYTEKCTTLRNMMTKGQLEKGNVNLTIIRTMLEKYKILYDEATYRTHRDAYLECVEEYKQLLETVKMANAVFKYRKQAQEIVDTTKRIMEDIVTTSNARRNRNLYRIESVCNFDNRRS